MPATTTTSSVSTSTATTVTDDVPDEIPGEERIVFIKKDKTRPGTFKLSRKSTKLLRRHNEGNLGEGFSRTRGAGVGSSFRLVKDGEGSRKIRDQGSFSIVRGQHGGSMLVKNGQDTSRSKSRKSKKSVRYADDINLGSDVSTNLDDVDGVYRDVSTKTDDVDEVDSDIADSPRRKKRLGLGSFRFNWNKKNSSMKRRDNEALKLIPEIGEDPKLSQGDFDCTDGGDVLAQRDNNEVSQKFRGSLKNVDGSPMLQRNGKTSSFRLPGETKRQSLKRNMQTASFRSIPEGIPSLKRDNACVSEGGSFRMKAETGTKSFQLISDRKPGSSPRPENDKGTVSLTKKDEEGKETSRESVSAYQQRDIVTGIRPSCLQNTTANTKPNEDAFILPKTSQAIGPNQSQTIVNDVSTGKNGIVNNTVFGAVCQIRNKDQCTLPESDKMEWIHPQTTHVSTAMSGEGTPGMNTDDCGNRAQYLSPEETFLTGPSAGRRGSNMKEEDFRKRTDSNVSTSSRSLVSRCPSVLGCSKQRYHYLGVKSTALK
jgi:hypothetical protein